MINKIENLLQGFQSGNKKSLARFISLIENGNEHNYLLLDKIYAQVGKAIRIGITGPPGAGKSTIINCLTKRYRHLGKTVGIIAIDPTSPFTGGALLGDRIRMNELASDEGVFIRSMATRGSSGGLALRTHEVADLLDAFGFDIIFLETIGVGQAELDIVDAADSIVVVLVPESGDAIQAMKAGLMEIADIFVVNKADREGADRAALQIQQALEFRNHNFDWKPPVLSMVANQGKGINLLEQNLEEHANYLASHHRRQNMKKNRIEKYLRQIINEKLVEKIWQPALKKKMEGQIDKIKQKKKSPYAAGQQIVKELLRNKIKN